MLFAIALDQFPALRRAQQPLSVLLDHAGNGLLGGAVVNRGLRLGFPLL